MRACIWSNLAERHDIRAAGRAFAINSNGMKVAKLGLAPAMRAPRAAKVERSGPKWSGNRGKLSHINPASKIHYPAAVGRRENRIVTLRIKQHQFVLLRCIGQLNRHVGDV